MQTETPGLPKTEGARAECVITMGKVKVGVVSPRSPFGELRTVNMTQGRLECPSALKIFLVEELLGTVVSERVTHVGNRGPGLSRDNWGVTRAAGRRAKPNIVLQPPSLSLEQDLGPS